MKKPELPLNEAERLNALYEYQILDTLPEEDLDDITKLASEICNTPISLISLIDQDRQWFKSRNGLQANETPRDVAFCAHAINTPEKPFIVNDSRSDNRFHDNPLVTNDPNVVFYAGIPLVNPDGFALGTLCVIDKVPHNLESNQIDALKILAKQIVNLFELQLSNKRLKTTQKILIKRNEDLNKFASVVSHDLKSPLANITSFIELLKLDYLHQFDEKGVRILSYISDSALKLRNMIEGILNYYKSDPIAQNKKELILLSDFFQSTFNFLNTPDNLSIEYPKAEINANKIALSQIFNNLISNSIRYNNKEIVSVKITCKEEDSDYHFTVTDNGIGIPEDQLDHVFELFRTVGKKDVKGVDSNGIGLSTVKKLINNLGGDIRVKSVENIETTFIFNIKK